MTPKSPPPERNGSRPQFTQAEQQAYISKLQARLERAATGKQAVQQELHVLRRRQNSPAAGQTGSTSAPRMQLSDGAPPDGPPRQNGATQVGNQLGNQRRARPRRDGTANMSEDREFLDTNLAFLQAQKIKIRSVNAHGSSTLCDVLF